MILLYLKDYIVIEVDYMYYEQGLLDYSHHLIQWYWGCSFMSYKRL